MQVQRRWVVQTPDMSVPGDVEPHQQDLEALIARRDGGDALSSELS